jgi:hypothetical protein
MDQYKDTHSYKTPVNERASLIFALRGIKAEVVELLVNDTKIAIFKPEYSDDWTPETITPINFLGDAAFHAGLIDTPKFVVTHTKDDGFPSVMFGICKDSLTWDKVTGDYFEELVAAHTLDGVKKMRLVYYRGGCGYASEPAVE